VTVDLGARDVIEGQLIIQGTFIEIVRQSNIAALGHIDLVLRHLVL